MERRGGVVKSDQDQMPVNLWLYQRRIPMNLQLGVDGLSENPSITKWTIAVAQIGQLSNRGSCKERDPTETRELLAGRKSVNTG